MSSSRAMPPQNAWVLINVGGGPTEDLEGLLRARTATDDVLGPNGV